MLITLKKAALASMIAVLSVTTACGSNQAAQNEAQSSPKAKSTERTTANGGMKAQSAGNNGQGIQMLSAEDAVLPLKKIGNVSYVSMQELAKVLEFQTGWQEPNRTLQIGDNDANFEITVNSTRASKDGHEIKTSDPFVLEGSTAYTPVTALGDLFQEDMTFEVKDGKLVIHPSSAVITVKNENDASPRGAAKELDFGEDPNDPYKGTDAAVNPASAGQRAEELEAWAPGDADGEAVPVLKNIDMNALIAKARQYLGVKYLFGAGSYAKTGKFDCSTYTQYVFGKYGVSLPRLSRQQAAQGTLVSRKNLRKGDLLFFYVPGRFKTNKTVGHVGIYIGNMQMIHASPEPKNGVQISNINKAYWKETFLRAKRVAY